MANPATVPGTKPTLDPFEHSSDAFEFHLFDSLSGPWHGIHLPMFGDDKGISKFMVLLALAAFIVGGLMIWLGRKMKSGDTPKGVLWNFIESIVFFVRDQIARPAIGEHDGDKYVPFLTTTFFFILVCNLLGMVPFLGSPTGSIAVTVGLALVSFIVTHAAGVKEMGFGGYIKSFVPHIHLDGGPAMQIFGLLLKIGLAGLELATPFIRVFVLAFRLFANMMAGHTALYIILYFIRMVSHPDWVNYNQTPDWLYYVVAPLSVLVVLAMSLLELLVAALQAFIFTLLTAIFTGLAKHPAH
jgi:F-type H+-transporting ATPase subunit a